MSSRRTRTSEIHLIRVEFVDREIHGLPGKGDGPDEVAFAESKRRGSDKLRLSQVRWLQAALEAGIPLECFLIVEWS